MGAPLHAARWPAVCHRTGARFHHHTISFSKCFFDSAKNWDGLDSLDYIDDGTLVLFADIIVRFTLQQFQTSSSRVAVWLISGHTAYDEWYSNRPLSTVWNKRGQHEITLIYSFKPKSNCAF